MYKLIKVVLCGATGVGKTSLLKRLINDPHEAYSESQTSTIGVDFKFIDMRAKESGNVIRFQIWDTAGQERFRSVAKNYFSGSQLFLYVYDVTRRESLDEIREWLKDSDWGKDCKTGSYGCFHTPSAIAFLVGNKCDAPPERRQLTYEDGDYFATAHGMVCFETSAKTGANVLGMFQAFTDLLDAKYKEMILEDGEGEEHERSVRVVENIQFLNSKEKKGCC